VLYNMVWGDDGTGGSTTPPNFGMSYADRSLGRSYITRKQDPLRQGAAEGRVEWGIVEFDLTRSRYEVFNTGEVRAYNYAATALATDRDSPPHYLVGSTWNGSASVDKSAKLQTVVTSGVPALRLSLGTLGAESVAAILSTTGLDLQGGGLSGVSTVAATGAISGSTLTVDGNGALGFFLRAQIQSSATGYVTLYNYNLDGFTGLQLGGVTSSFPMIKRSGAGVGIRLADDSADAALTAANLDLTGSGHLKFGGNIVFEGDGASVYMSPMNDTNGQFYIFTGGAQRMVISNLGVIRVNSTLSFGWTLRSNMTSSADGYIELLNNAGTAFTGLRFGGSTASFPMIKRNGAGIDLRLADDSGYAALAASTGTFSGALTTNSKTVYTNLSAIGRNDRDAQTGGDYYRVYTMEETAPTLYATAVSGTNNTAGGGLAGPRHDDSNTVNTASTASASYRGAMGVFTRTVGYAACARAVSFAFVPNSGVTTVINVLFRTPAAASDATNDYTFSVGPLAAGATPIRGWYIKYRHSVNSGNWQLAAVNTSASGESTVDTAVPFVANTWMTLSVTLPASGSSVSATLTYGGNTYSLGSISYGSMEAPASQAITSVGGMVMVRNATDSTTYRAGYINRVSVTGTGLTVGG
jgi:hypothetical protein